ncbi:hypothetical protein Fmac_021317 [Flemingia macrophylla]|uniref:Apple domain-containing protein n=1 Tax=Flemingia macrophylla TaxID=520843 RepID=A0ABD1LY85_9FABA
MAPEYVVDGLFSIKSDVFSFGILVLEIICGKRNRGLYHAYKNLNLVDHAWSTWKARKAIELIDPNMKESCVISEVLCCLHINLLCVQQYPEDRPTMASVILMLESHMELVKPKEHGFIPRNVPDEEDLPSSKKDTSSTNDTNSKRGLSNLKDSVPDVYIWLDDNIGLEECTVKCLNNRSCMAYTYSDTYIRSGGSGCVMWFVDLVDMQ